MSEIFNNKTKVYLPLFLAVAIAGGIFIGINLKNGEGTKESTFIYPRQDKLNSLLNLVEQDYVDKVSRDSLVETILPKILKELDPHSAYIPAKQVEEVSEPLQGNFGGIGVQFNMTKDTVTIVMVIQGGPSEKVGLMPGDRIVTIEDSVIAGKRIKSSNIVKMLKGTIGTDVNIGVKRRGTKELIDFKITRGEIPIHSIDIAYKLTDSIGYVKIIRFSQTTYQEFQEAILKLRKQGISKLIVDLRENTGGYMVAATQIANQFLGEDQLIVYTEGQNRPRSNIYADKTGTCLDLDIAILINETSASASEILAGAIQDNDRGTIIGRRSFGKGLVQQPSTFSDGSVVRLTISRYYTPSGRCIQKPYSGDDKDYYLEIYERYQNGEFYEKDSIHLTDTLKYFTSSGRTVYGGGGIVPDLFVSVDTMDITPYYNKIFKRGLIYRFAFDYTDKQRKEISDFTNYQQIVDYLKSHNVFNQFIDFAKSRGIEPNWKEINKAKKILETQLFASIARNIIDNKGFYPIIKDIDKTLLDAIKELKNPSISLSKKD